MLIKMSGFQLSEPWCKDPPPTELFQMHTKEHGTVRQLSSVFFFVLLWRFIGTSAFFIIIPNWGAARIWPNTQIFWLRQLCIAQDLQRNVLLEGGHNIGIWSIAHHSDYRSVPLKHTSGMWRHTTHSITLDVDDFKSTILTRLILTTFSLLSGTSSV